MPSPTNGYSSYSIFPPANSRLLGIHLLVIVKKIRDVSFSDFCWYKEHSPANIQCFCMYSEVYTVGRLLFFNWLEGKFLEELFGFRGKVSSSWWIEILSRFILFYNFVTFYYFETFLSILWEAFQVSTEILETYRTKTIKKLCTRSDLRIHFVSITSQIQPKTKPKAF